MILLSNKYSYNYIAYIICFLIGMSDPFVILQILSPLLFFYMINLLLKEDVNSKLIFYFKALIFSIFGKITLDFLVTKKVLIVPEVPIFKTFKSILRNNLAVDNIIKSSYQFFNEVNEFQTLFILIITVLLILSYYSFIHKSKVIFTLIITFIYSFTLLFLFQGLFGLWIGYRYMWFFYIFPPIILGIILYLTIKNNVINKNIYNITIYSLSLIFLILQIYFSYDKVVSIYNSYSKSKLKDSKFKLDEISYPHQNLSPPYIICLKEIQSEYLIQYGISDYWNSKFITFFSNQTFLVNAFQENLEPYFWINNKKHYINISKDKNYQFIIPERLNTKLILERYGNPTIIKICNKKEIWIYKQGVIEKN